MADISKEIQNFRSARRGKDVRGSMISLAEKVNKESTDAKTAAAKSASDAGTAASNASYAVTQANTAAQNANTAAQNIQTKADRGDFTGTIRIGEVSTGEPGSQASANNSGTAKDAVIDLTIPRGYQGVSIRMAGTWTAGTEYVNNTSHIDLVTYNGGTYGCKQTHTASEETAPPFEGNEYWQVVAKKGDTGGIENIDTTPIEFEEAEERENIESGEPLPKGLGKIRKWLSSFKQAAFMNVVNGVAQSVAGQAVLDAAVGKYLDEKKLDISRIVANRNITELGFAMDGKTAADWLNELNGKIPTKMHVESSNEINIAYGYKETSGNAYINYRGANTPINIYHLQKGISDMDLSSLNVADILVDGKSLTSDLGLKSNYATFKSVELIDKGQTSHIDVIKIHWNELWDIGGGFRFVMTFHGNNRCFWLCCSYLEKTYGTALMLPYDGGPHYYRIVNGKWLDPISL